MFGLKESGFVISLGVTLLLGGLITYYVRQRMAEMDDKNSQVMSMIQQIAGETNRQNLVLNNLSQMQCVQTEQQQQHGKINVPDMNTVLESSDEDASSDSDEDTDSDNESIENQETRIVEINQDSIMETSITAAWNEENNDLQVVETNQLVSRLSHTESSSDDEDESSSEESNTEVPVIVEVEPVVDDAPVENDGAEDDGDVEDDEGEIQLPTIPDLNSMTMQVLKEYAKEKGVKIPTKIKKGNLVELLQNQ